MAKYQPRIDVWALSPEERAKLQPGQHISAGKGGAPGVYLGQTPHGSDVALWEGGAPKGAARLTKIHALRDYVNGTHGKRSMRKA